VGWQSPGQGQNEAEALAPDLDGSANPEIAEVPRASSMPSVRRCAPIHLVLSPWANGETTGAYLHTVKTVSGIPLVSLPDLQVEAHAKLPVIALGWILGHVNGLHRADLSAKTTALTGLEIHQSVLIGRRQLRFSEQHTYIAVTPEIRVQTDTKTPENAQPCLVLRQPIRERGLGSDLNPPKLAAPRPNSSKRLTSSPRHPATL